MSCIRVDLLIKVDKHCTPALSNKRWEFGYSCNETTATL